MSQPHVLHGPPANDPDNPDALIAEILALHEFLYDVLMTYWAAHPATTPAIVYAAVHGVLSTFQGPDPPHAPA